MISLVEQNNNVASWGICFLIIVPTTKPWVYKTPSTYPYPNFIAISQNIALSPQLNFLLNNLSLFSELCALLHLFIYLFAGLTV